MIKTDHLCKRYQSVIAVEDITFQVRPGEVLGFLGPNGAGKTTTMRMLAGFVTPTSGRASIFGLLLAFAVLFPRAQLLLLLPPIPMPAWLFVSLYGVLELIFGVTGTFADIAHFAHLGGMIGGALMMLYWHLSGRVRWRPD